jgi:hypothetical protein
LATITGNIFRISKDDVSKALKYAGPAHQITDIYIGKN